MGRLWRRWRSVEIEKEVLGERTKCDISEKSYIRKQEEADSDG